MLYPVDDTTNCTPLKGWKEREREYLTLFLRRRPRVAQVVEGAADRDFDPAAHLGLAADEVAFGLQQQHAVRRQSVDAFVRFPFRRLLLGPKGQKNRAVRSLISTRYPIPPYRRFVHHSSV